MKAEARADPEPRRGSRLNWWFDSPRLDLVIAGGVVGAYGYATVRHGDDLLGRLDADTIGDVYQTIAGSSAALLGLSVTAIAIFLAITPGARFRHLLAHRRDLVTRIFITSVAGLGLAVLVAVVAAMLDDGRPDGTAKWVHAAVYASFLVAVLRSTRLIWLFSFLVRIASQEAFEESREDSRTPTNLRRGSAA